MNPLLHWLTSPEWTHLVGALLHSLWQGAILAVALALGLRWLTNPVTRYRCALGALGLLLIANLITWAVLNDPQPTMPVASPAPILEAPAPTVASAPHPNTANKIIAIAAFAQPQAKINWTGWIALAWMFGALLMLMRASIKVAGAEKLRCSCRPLNNEPIALLVAEACRAVKLTRKIRVAVTDQLTSPAVVGVLVPTLILPLSLFTTLTPTQIQFVLLHELAHIRRGDYLANLFQLFAESLWFFNPAVWWISHQIRREREACCDALAIELSGAPADYARTLVHVAENILQTAPAAAPAFGDNGREPSSLADRVQRLLVPGYRPTLRLTWRAMLTALLVGSGLLFLSALGTRVTVAAILSPRERIERIEKKMIEYGESLDPNAATDNPNAPQVEISGRVTMADESPLPKVKWVNIYYSRKSVSGASSAKLLTNGFFSTKVQASGRMAAMVDEPGYAPVVAGPITLGGTNRVPALDLILTRGFTVPIQVTDAETGKPIGGALVKAQFGLPNMGFSFGEGRLLRTDATGITAMPQCSASVELSLVVSAPGYEIVAHKFAQLRADEVIPIKLQQGYPMSGVVLAKATGAPLAGATVRMRYEKGPQGSYYQWTDATRVLATTDAQGRFTTTQLRRGTKYWLGISAPGHESVLLGPVQVGSETLSALLGPELIVRGRVLGDLNGLQIIDKEYCLSRHYSEVFDNYSQGFQQWLPVRMVDGVTTFQFTNPIPGMVKLSSREGFTTEREVTEPVADWVIDLSKTQKVVAEARPKREVIFRFTHTSNESPRGVVSVTIPDNLDPKHLTAHTAKIGITNSEVRTQIAIGGRTGIEPERMVGYWFDRAGKNGSLLSIEVTNGPGPMVIEIPILPAGAIYAKARNPDGSPAAGLFFGVRELKRAPRRSDNGSLGSGSDSISDDGPRTWVSGPLPLGGTYQVHGWRGNLFSVSKAIALTEEKPDAEVELQFPPGKTITGLLLDPDGQPLRNVELQANFSLANGHGFGLKPIVTDDKGEFRLENTTPELGQYSIEVSVPGLRAENVKLNFSGQPQTIRLKRGLTLTGRVVEAGTGNVIPNTEVRAWDSESYKQPAQKCRTDAEGRFEFSTLADVNYSFHVEDGSLSRNVSARPSQVTNLTLAIKLYEWSKVKPKPKVAQMETQAQEMKTELERQSNDLTVLSNQVSKLKEDLSVARRLEWIRKGLIAQGSESSHTNKASNPASVIVTNSSREPLYVRAFEVSPKFLHENVITNLSAFEINQLPANTNHAVIAFAALRAWIQRMGVELDPAFGKSLYYKDRKGMLLIRATMSELDSIETALRDQLPSAPQLASRTFELEPTTIARAIETQLPQFKPVTATNVTAGLRALLESAGADLSPPKSIFYNDRAGGLFVRATPQELDAIEDLLQVIGRQPPQVNVKAVFVELPLGKDQPKALAKLLEPVTPENTAAFTGILTAPQFKLILRTLETNSGVRILAAPQVTTLSGRQAQLQVAEVRTIISGMTAAVTNGMTNFVYQSQAMPFGPVLDVLPTVSNDGQTIQMTLSPTITEFLGYEDAKKLKLAAPDDKATLPLPLVRKRQMNTSASVWDGQTIVLGNFSDQILTTPVELKNANQTPTKPQNKQLLVFVTPTIIDQGGNPKNAALEVPSASSLR